MQILQPLLNNNQIPQYKPMTWYNTAYLGFSRDMHQMACTNGSYQHGWRPQFGYDPTYTEAYQTFYNVKFLSLPHPLPHLTSSLRVTKWYKKNVFSLKKNHVHTVFDRPHPFLLNNMILQAITSPMDSALLNSFAFFSPKWN